MEFWYNFTRLLGLTYRKFLIPRLHVMGEENLFKGPKIIVANHSFASDVFIIPAIIKDRLHFLVEEELLTLPFFGRLLDLADQIPVVTGKGKQALETAYDRLSQGHSIVIFPEGQLSHGKSVNRARSGAVMLAMDSGYPLLPLGIFTPPKFVRMLKARNFDRETLGGWQFGGASFVSIGQAWDIANDIVSVKDMEGYRKLRRASDDLHDRIDLLVKNATDLADKLGIQNQLPSGLE